MIGAPGVILIPCYCARIVHRIADPYLLFLYRRYKYIYFSLNNFYITINLICEINKIVPFIGIDFLLEKYIDIYKICANNRCLLFLIILLEIVSCFP